MRHCSGGSDTTRRGGRPPTLQRSADGRGRLYHETHLAPLPHMQGHVGGVAFDLRAKDGRRLPVLVTSAVKTGADGEPLLIHTTLFDARDRRAYEQELLRARQVAECCARNTSPAAPDTAQATSPRRAARSSASSPSPSSQRQPSPWR